MIHFVPKPIEFRQMRTHGVFFHMIVSRTCAVALTRPAGIASVMNQIGDESACKVGVRDNPSASQLFTREGSFNCMAIDDFTAKGARARHHEPAAAGLLRVALVPPLAC